MAKNSKSCECCNTVHSEIVTELPNRPLKITEIAALRKENNNVFSKSPMSIKGTELGIEDTEQYTTIFILGTNAIARTLCYHAEIGWVVEDKSKVPKKGDAKKIAMDLFNNTAQNIKSMNNSSPNRKIPSE